MITYGHTPTVILGQSTPALSGQAQVAQQTSSNAVELTVSVPLGAKVYVNEKLTTSTGAQRVYTTKNLDPTQTYTYSVRAEYEHQGQSVSQTKTALLAVGKPGQLSFTPGEPVTTALTVKVPTDAKVYLAGKETTLTGDVRKFVTTRLPAGQQWTNYAVRVEVERNGEKLTKEEQVSLQAGDSRELSFEFPVASVARAAAR